MKVKVKVELSYLGRGEKMSNMQAWAAQPLMPASFKGYPESHVRSRDVFTLSVLPPTKSGFQSSDDRILPRRPERKGNI